MMNWGYGSGWGSMMMGLSMIVFWALVIGAIVLVVRWFTKTNAAPWSPTDPERTLAERYARGEIDGSEYHERLAVLRGTHRSPAH